jgi:hypothetical protein
MNQDIFLIATAVIRQAFPRKMAIESLKAPGAGSAESLKSIGMIV